MLVTILGCTTEDKSINPLDQVIHLLDDSFPKIVANPDKFELQIRYTQVDKKDDGSLDFTSFDFNIDSNKYYYPASTVKMPAAFIALEKLDSLHATNPAITLDTPIRYGIGAEPQTNFNLDTTAKNFTPTIRHLVNSVFAVSDNNAYNRLYEFVGQEHLNDKLREKRIFTNSRIITRVGISGFDLESNRKTNPFEFYSNDELLYSEAKKYCNESYIDKNISHTIKGLGYTKDDSLVNEPFDMGEKNFISIPELEASLMALIFPSEDKKYNLTDKTRSFALQAMSRLPKEHQYPIYDRETYYDGYVKFFMYGDTKDEIPPNIRIFNKVGYAYGTLTDCAFIVDLENNISFFLTATILVNENQIFNDGNYEYDELGIPFLAELGRQLYSYEKSRKAERPNLQEFSMNYSIEE